MNILQRLLALFRPIRSGALLDDPQKLEALPRHELFAGGGEPVKWKALMPPYRNQGASMFCTAYAGTAIGSAFEKKESGKTAIFSPRELFYRTGGSPEGNYLINTANGMHEGFVFEDDVVTTLPKWWNIEIWHELKDTAKATAEMLARGKPYRTKSAAIVNPDWKALKQALASSPLMVVIGVGRGYFEAVAPKISSYGAYHAVVLVDLVEDELGNRKYIEIFDSLTCVDGFRKLAPDYEILMAMSFIDLPNEWKEVQKAAEPKMGALEHYGKRRNLIWEQLAAAQLAKTLKLHPSLSAIAGREWTTAVNALAYGGYSMQDLLNSWTQQRRLGKSIFNLNIPRQ